MKILRIVCFVSLMISWFNAHSQLDKLQIYGFFDFELEVGNKDITSKKWTFDQHHLNILTNYPITNQFTVATEIEWEHVPFVSSGQNEGKIYLANAYLQYKYSDALLVKVGTFMTPFGIYNERHDATPTFISTFLSPSIYGEHPLIPGVIGRLYSKHSTGIQVFGNIYSGDWGAKYKLFLNNGRGPKSGERDMNANKGFGWRFIVNPPIKELTFGTSYYTDLNGLAKDIRQNTFGFDAELNLPSALFQAEFIYSKIENIGFTEIPNGIFRKVIGYNVLGSYTFFNKLSPFLQYDYYGPEGKSSNKAEHLIMAGINYSITNSIFIKSEVHFYRFNDGMKKDYEMFVSSIAVAF